MSYKLNNWRLEQDFISSYHFYSLSDVMKYLGKVLKFITDTPMKLSEARCPQLPLNSSCPADLGQRFPDNQFYVCDGLGTWKTEVDLLHVALAACTDRDHCGREYTLFGTVGAAEIYAIDQVYRVGEKIRMDKIDRDDFERYFGLTWIDGNDAKIHQQ